MDEKPLRILLVEDDEDDFIMMRDLLSEIEGRKFSIDWVATYDAALEAIGRNQHDVYLLDFYLGERNGLELMGEALANDCKAPMIMLTGLGDSEVDIQAMKAGAADYLEKDKMGAFVLDRTISHAIERARILAAMRESQNLLKTVFDTVPIGIYVKDREGKYLMVNNTHAESYGLSPEAFKNSTLRDLGVSTEEEINRILDTDRHVTETGEMVHVPEEKIISSNGDVVWRRGVKVPLYGDGGKTIGIVGFREDITQRKQAEQEMYALNQELSLFNEKLQRETEEKDGALEKLKETQSHLLQSEKMASLGQLAAGVAHEINNPIGFISSNLNTFRDYFNHIQHLLRRYHELENLTSIRNGETAALLECIQAQKREIDFEYIMEDSPGLIADSLEGAARVVSIVQNLKEFSHVDQAEKQWIDLNHGIKTTLQLIWNELKYKCRVEKKLGAIKAIECYPQQLNQVFLNLLVNASQAIEKEGVITVKTAMEDRHVVVKFQDTGAGIAQEHLPHVFEPFFTTKPVGEGTGLGLSLVYNIIERHQGTIEVESQLGRGTTFTIRLPIQFDEEKSREAS